MIGAGFLSNRLWRRVEQAERVAGALVSNKETAKEWMRCGETWFAGVNLLPNDASGGVFGRDVPPLGGRAVSFIENVLGNRAFDWDRAQVSVCFPGYPQP